MSSSATSLSYFQLVGEGQGEGVGLGFFFFKYFFVNQQVDTYWLGR